MSHTMAKAEPTLVLRPSIHDFDREQVEAFVENIRVKRLAATVAFYEHKNEKLGNAQDKIQKKFTYQLEMLEKDIAKCEAAEVRVEDRLQKIDLLLQEMGDLVNQLTITTEEADED